MGYFTPNSSLWSVAHCKEFRPFRKYIINPRSLYALMQVYRIKQLKLFYPADSESVADGLNELRNRCIEDPMVFHDFGQGVCLYSFLIGRDRPLVLVLPGGGYGDVCSMIEGFPIAAKLNKLGFNAFVGQYRVGKQAHYPNPMDDVAKMLEYIFDIAAKQHIQKEGYAVLGCSAGGHLAACWGTKSLGYEHHGLPKPKALFLAYPVITMGEFTHKGSRKNLLGKETDNVEIQDRYSVEKQIDLDYPKTYEWQCKNDKVVPYQNSRLLLDALKKNHVEHEHFPVEGDKHGLGLGQNTAAEPWLEDAVRFWQK